MRTSFVMLLVMAGFLVGGCASGPVRPARISHVVFLKLVDPAETDALIADCDRLLPRIPGVVSYCAGKHVETGRSTVDSDYDVGLYVGFRTESDYAVYVDHPLHIELVTTWRPRLEWLRVYDVLDETP